MLDFRRPGCESIWNRASFARIGYDIGMTEDKYESLRALLNSQETFPTLYTHKFIGRNTGAFGAGVKSLEERFPALRLKTSRTTRSEAHLSLTYVFEAESAEAIIEVLEYTHGIEDLYMML